MANVDGKQQESKAVVVWDRSGVLAAVLDERQRQDTQWGGPGHDDGHDQGDWLIFIEEKLRRMQDERVGSDDALHRRRLVQVAALAVAAIESFDRKGEA